MAELSTVARPYAEALFAVAKNDPAGLAAWSEAVNELAQLSNLNDVRDAMSDPQLERKTREDVFLGLLKAPLSQPMHNFVDLLIENDRLLLLPQIAEQFEALKNRNDGTAQADIISAFEMSDAQVQELIAGLEKKFGVKLKPVVTVDPSLIGGVRVTVGDQVLDTSVQAQLSRLRDTLAAH